MQVDINLIIAVLGGCLSAATFFIGRQTASHADGEKAGVVAANLECIKESVARIERKLNEDVKGLTDRIDKMSCEVSELREDVTWAIESAKSAHKRIDNVQTELRGRS